MSFAPVRQLPPGAGTTPVGRFPGAGGQPGAGAPTAGTRPRLIRWIAKTPALFRRGAGFTLVAGFGKAFDRQPDLHSLFAGGRPHAGGMRLRALDRDICPGAALVAQRDPLPPVRLADDGEVGVVLAVLHVRALAELRSSSTAPITTICQPSTGPTRATASTNAASGPLASTDPRPYSCPPRSAPGSHPAPYRYAPTGRPVVVPPPRTPTAFPIPSTKARL